MTKISIDALYDGVYNRGMESTWADIIRRAVNESGLTLMDVSRASGVAYPRVHVFVRGGRGIMIDNAERIARAVGLELRATKRTKKGR